MVSAQGLWNVVMLFVVLVVVSLQRKDKESLVMKFVALVVVSLQ